MRGGTSTRVADAADGHASVELESLGNQARREVCVQTLDPVAVVDDDVLAEHVVPGGNADAPRTDARDEVTRAAAEVDAAMESDAGTGDRIEPPSKA